MTSQLLVTSQLLDHMSETFAGWLTSLAAQLQGKETGGHFRPKVPQGVVGRCEGWRQPGKVGGHSSGQEHLTHEWVCLCGPLECPSCHHLEKTYIVYLWVHASLWIFASWSAAKSACVWNRSLWEISWIISFKAIAPSKVIFWCWRLNSEGHCSSLMKLS